MGLPKQKTVKMHLGRIAESPKIDLGTVVRMQNVDKTMKKRRLHPRHAHNEICRRFKVGWSNPSGKRHTHMHLTSPKSMAHIGSLWHIAVHGARLAMHSWQDEPCMLDRVVPHTSDMYTMGLAEVPVHVGVPPSNLEDLAATVSGRHCSTECCPRRHERSQQRRDRAGGDYPADPPTTR